ncbi:MAG TPA: PVC-type heme-binding CxxCH protein [Gemmataceae bacterium]|jgi:putative heme-binding domain-containing protein|nr:PVC-type heme-binding CxxCH protein [Gemmataceae bacterium]
MPRTLPRFCEASLIVALLATSLFAQRDAKVPDPDPELERKTFQLPPGFEVNLYAADPLLAKPIQMNFDAKGRLWVACSETYPQIEPGKKANDKIIILEDTKGVGRADKTTVFMDGLLIPTGIEPGDSGCYVANSTEILHVEEKDGKAGKVRVMLSGFGTEDTHHIIHAFRWGEDGCLYFNQSIYIHSHIETPHGPRHLNAGGIWRYRPETQELEIFARGWVNSWGHAFDRWGQSFATDGAYGEGINYVVPGAYYVSAVGSPRLLPGLNPGQPKQCGLEIVGGRHLPDDWQGNLITNDFRGHRVNRFALKEDGAGYLSIQLPDLIRSDHPAFRPVDVKMGPDGAIYIADWYNPIIQHGEVDFRDERRDHTHGRIWRITVKDRPLVERPKLADATVEQLLEHLKDPEQWARHFAKRVLKERGAKQVLNALDKWADGLDPKDAEYEHNMLEALWAYQSLANVLTPELTAKLLQAHDPRVRAAAMRVCGYWYPSSPGGLADLGKGVSDEKPQVRLEAVRALAQTPWARAAGTAARALNKPMDRWLDYALWLTMRELEPAWMTALQKGEMPFGDVKHLIFALQAVNARDAAPTLVKLLNSGKVKKEQETELLALLAGEGGPPDLALVLDRALSDETQGKARATMLTALENAARRRQVKPTGDLNRIAAFLKSKDLDTRLVASKLVGAWKLAGLLNWLREVADYDDEKSVRQAALNSIGEIGGRAARTILGEQAEKWLDSTMRRSAIVALLNVDIDYSAKFASELLASNPPAEDVSELVSAYLGRKNGAAILAKALSDKTLSLDSAKVALRTMRSTGREVPELTAALTKAGNLTEPRHVLTPAEMKQMVADVQKLGDPARGEIVFRRKDMLCFKCHAIAGAGGQAGPDLISLGASAQIDYIIDSLLLPNKQVKEGYNALLVEMKDGKQFTGIKVRETPKELVLHDADDKEIVLAADNVDNKKIGGSIMPEGLVDPLTRRELIDLTRFLSELGKVGGKYSVGPARLVRRWQVLEYGKEANTLLYRVGIHAMAGNEPGLVWLPAYSTVSGDLPMVGLPHFDWAKGFQEVKIPFAFVRCQLDVSNPGKAKLKFNSDKGLSLWINGTPVAVKEEKIVDLAAGLQTLTFAIDLQERKEPLRVELDDVAGSGARVRILGGK